MDLRSAYLTDRIDWQRDGYQLATDSTLETAVLISLFTDARSGDDDGLPEGADRRGWWGDALADVPGDRIGSRLWLLAREKATNAVLQRAREYAEESLRWLVEDGVASAVQVTASRLDDSTLWLDVEISRPAGRVARYRYDYVWRR